MRTFAFSFSWFAGLFFLIARRVADCQRCATEAASSNDDPQASDRLALRAADNTKPQPAREISVVSKSSHTSVTLFCKPGDDNRQDNENRQYHTCREKESRMSGEESAQECLQPGVGRQSALRLIVRRALHVISIVQAHCL